MLVGITLLLLEFGIRLFFPQPINYYNFTLVQGEGGGQMVLGSDLHSNGKKVIGHGPYIPNLSTQFGGVAVSINSHGWRDADYPMQKREDITRIMIVGDSVTFGYGVQLDDMFSKVLERELNRQGKGTLRGHKPGRRRRKYLLSEKRHKRQCADYLTSFGGSGFQFK